MPALDALHAKMALRGMVAGLLLFHAASLALPGPRPAARLALLRFVMSVLAYLFCQQAELLLYLPRWLAYGLLIWCVAGAAWLWVAARALFDDRFRWSAPVLTLLGAATLIGLSANLPYSPDGDGPYRTFPVDAPVVWLGHLQSLRMLSFTVLALWEGARGWRGDLVEARRAARRWVAMGIGLYADLALVIEIALKGQPVGRLLPALHILGIGTIAFGLALLVARRSLSEVLGFVDAAPPLRQRLPAEGGETGLVRSPAVGTADSKVARRLEELDRAMTQSRAYRREGLSLSDLAQTLNMSEAALRELINQRLGFSQFQRLPTPPPLATGHRAPVSRGPAHPVDCAAVRLRLDRPLQPGLQAAHGRDADRVPRRSAAGAVDAGSTHRTAEVIIRPDLTTNRRGFATNRPDGLGGVP